MIRSLRDSSGGVIYYEYDCDEPGNVLLLNGPVMIDGRVRWMESGHEIGFDRYCLLRGIVGEEKFLLRINHECK